MVNEIISITKRVASMSEQELDDRLKEMQTLAKDLDDLGLGLSAAQQLEAMMILSRMGLPSPDPDADGE